MATWSEFETSAPALAAIFRERFDPTGLLMLASLRKTGGPRITPIEYFVFEGELCLGGMWQSKKMLDLVRDPRCSLHSLTTSKDGDQGDCKLYGLAVDATGPAFRARYVDALHAATGFRPREPFHLVTIDIREAAFTVFSPPAVEAARARLAGDPSVRLRLLPAVGGAVQYLVATWKPPL